MSATAEETKVVTRAAGRALPLGRTPSNGASPSAPGTAPGITASHGGPLSPGLSVPLRSHTMGLLFQVILLMAACLSLVAVIQQARATAESGTGVNDNPPAVFVTTD